MEAAIKNLWLVPRRELEELAEHSVIAQMALGVVRKYERRGIEVVVMQNDLGLLSVHTPKPYREETIKLGDGEPTITMSFLPL